MISTRDAIRHPDHSGRREGIIAGLLGAVVVAVFYFVLDISRGQALMTPTVLGEMLILHAPITATPDPAAIFIYTTLHGVAFIALGMLLSVLMRAADRSALARYAIVQLLVVFEVFFYGLLSIVSDRARGLFPFLGVLAANTLAASTMIAWLWRHSSFLPSAGRSSGSRSEPTRSRTRPPRRCNDTERLRR